MAGPQAFAESGGDADLSRAAILLLLRAQLGAKGFAEIIPAEDLSRFPVPRLRRAGERISTDRVRERLAQRYVGEVREEISLEEQSKRISDVLTDLATRLYERPSLLTAAELTEASLAHPDELTRVAAAATHFELHSDPQKALEVLVRGTEGSEDLVRNIAATVLARLVPDHPSLSRLTEPDTRSDGGKPSRTSLLVHGTWARNNGWWQPGGEFHAYLSTIRPDLYGASDRFDWSGGWSDGARENGAEEFRGWTESKGLQGLDVFSHSHGGSVAMLASHKGIPIGKLVLLSCPAHPQKYMPNFPRVAKVVSVRVRLDLVILADGGGQRFRHPKIRENVLPIWFNHSATHSPEVWRAHDIPAKL